MQKGFGRLVYVDALAALEPSTEGESLAAAAAAVDAEAVGGAAAVPVALLAVDYETSLEDRALEGALRQASAADFAAKMHASSFASKEVRGARVAEEMRELGVLSARSSRTSSTSPYLPNWLRRHPCRGNCRQVGNCYTGAVFVNLLSLVCEAGPDALAGKRLGVFSYGSGSVSERAREPQ